MVKPLRNDDPIVVGPYRLLGRLGAGGMGQVYLAISRSGRKVALKVVHEELAEDPEFRKRFAREVEAARAVSALYTASVVDADPTSADPWCATTYIDGPTLTDRVLEDGSFSVAQTLTLAAGLAEALAGIHAAGLIHRDLKPGNVMLTDSGPQVIDFGIALALNGTRLTRSVILGTPSYMAPERLLGEAERAASDVFALGACLVFASAGHGIVNEDVINAQVGQILAGRLDLTGVPGTLRPLIQMCLAREPKARPTAPELLAILLASQTPMPEPGWYQPTKESDTGEHRVVLPRRRLGRRAVLLLGIAGSVALGAGGWLGFGRGGVTPPTNSATPSPSSSAESFTWEVSREYAFPFTNPHWMETRALKGKQVVLASDRRRLVGWDPDKTETVIDIQVRSGENGVMPTGFVPGIIRVDGRWAVVQRDTSLVRHYAIDIVTGKQIAQVFASPTGMLGWALLTVFQDRERPVAYGMWWDDSEPGVASTMGCWRLDTGERLASPFSDDPMTKMQDGDFPHFALVGEIIAPGEELEPPALICSVPVTNKNLGILMKQALGQDAGTTIVLPSGMFIRVMEPLISQVMDSQVVVLSSDGLSTWDLGTGRQNAGPFTPVGELIPMLAACSLPKLAVVAATAAGELLLWDPTFGEPLGEPRLAHQGAILGLATVGSGTNQRAVSAGSDGKLRIWQIRRT